MTASMIIHVSTARYELLLHYCLYCCPQDWLLLSDYIFYIWYL